MSAPVERRPWPRCTAYIVGDDGSITGPRGWPLKPWTTDTGYLQVHTMIRGRRVARPVHVMVCETFHGARPPGREAAHGNGVRTDCRAANLSWKTRPDNHADKHLHGTAQRGETANNHKLTEREVLDIRRRAAAGEGAVALGREFRVSRMTVHRVVTRRSWVHV